MGEDESSKDELIQEQQNVEIDEDVVESKTLSVEDLKGQLREALESGKGREAWKGIVDKIVAFGPRGMGPNLLIDATKDGLFPKVFSDDEIEGDAPKADEALHAAHLCDKVTYAFQLATNQGPLCNEPVQELALLSKTWSWRPQKKTLSPRSTGQTNRGGIKTVQQSIRQGFLDWSPRIMLAMYSCEIQASSMWPFLPLSYQSLSRSSS